MTIQGLWDRQSDTIIYVKLGDADTNPYKYEPMVEILAWWENINKYKHSDNCHYQRKHFSPFVIYVYGMLGR